MFRASRLLAALCLVVFVVPARAQTDEAPKVHARLIAGARAIAPGGTMSVALEEDIRAGWHTYWINPGEAGQPTEITWTLPPGWKASAIQWPYPKRLPVGPLMDYGYEGKPWLLIDITAPANAKPGTVTLKAAVDWLVCREICVPEDTVLSLPVQVSAAPPPPDGATAQAFAAARAKLPVPSPWPMRFGAGAALDLFVNAPMLAAAHPADAAFFPLEDGTVQGSAEQKLGFASDGLVLRLTPGKKFAATHPLTGVLVLTSKDGSVQALTVDAKSGPVPAVDFADNSAMGLLLALLFAFAGGLILNLMPCVLPILAMKALALASHAGAERGAAAREGLAYGAGAILSFAAFGLAIVLLRAGGAAVGWGLQLQEPILVAGFALLIFAVGLNLSGVFEVGGVAAGDSLARRGGAAGAFFTGVLAVAVAAPCTAPFMAAALGYALTQSAPLALCVFVALGLGFAAPFILLGLWPALQRLLPRPGAWMNWLRQLLAFPMYGAAVWLVWVLAEEAGAQGVVVTLAAMVALGFALWLWGATRNLSPRGRGLGGVLALIALVGALSCLALLRGAVAPSVAAPASSSSETYSAARLAQLRGENRPVFIDATAAWCITCLVNEQTALSRPAVRQAFAARHVAYLIADWTNRNAEITHLLEAHGRSGVPLYLYYAPGAGEAVVLPQILTSGIVLDAIGAR